VLQDHRYLLTQEHEFNVSVEDNSVRILASCMISEKLWEYSMMKTSDM